MKVKLSGIGLDTSTLDYNPGVMYGDDNYSYIYTSISSNNDFLLPTFLSAFKTSPILMVHSDYLDSLEIGLHGHLKALERTVAKVLLISSDADWTFIGSLEKVAAQGLAENFGIQAGPGFTVEQLVELREKMAEKKITLSFLALPVCPLEFNYEVLSYCHENNIHVVGLNPFGGNLSAQRNIQAFSAPYLLGFAATYCDIILLSGRDLNRSEESLYFLQDLFGKDVRPEHILKKSVSRAVKELKKAVYTSVQVGDDGEFIIPYDSPTTLIEPDFLTTKIGSYSEKFIEKPDVVSDIETIEDIDKEEAATQDTVQHLINILYYPNDGKPSDKFAVSRYKAMEYLGLHFRKEDGWSVELVKIGNTVFCINAVKEPSKKGHFLWTRVVPGEERRFFLVMPKEGTIIFREIKENADNGE